MIELRTRISEERVMAIDPDTIRLYLSDRGYSREKVSATSELWIHRAGEDSFLSNLFISPDRSIASKYEACIEMVVQELARWFGQSELDIFREMEAVNVLYDKMSAIRDHSFPEVKEASQATDFLKMYPHAKCDEHCGECDADVSIPAYRRSFCPECGEPILPCSMCSVSMQLNACGTPQCPYFKEGEE